ncbi:MAG: PDZ domain-containing protein [Verrucomicrobiota bacterium]|jgi:tricorn protease|nr:MAG: protease [Verrucomicrobiota bacterium]
MRKLLAFIVLGLFQGLDITLAEGSEAKLLHFPATNGHQIVFSYAGQLYSVATDGGLARRLTNTPGYAVFPRFSADGKQLAYTAQYDGNTEVYVMPSDGGVPVRLTTSATLQRDDISDRMGPNNLVMTWKNTTPEVIFRSRMRSYNDFVGQLYSVGMEGDLPKQVPVPMGGFVSYSPDDSKIAYNRVFREFRTWKDYRGGMADDVWIYDFKTKALENITNDREHSQNIVPMWGPDNKIYFISDRDGRMNLFSYDLESKQTNQYTHFKDFDIKFPSLGGNVIVFEEAGVVWKFDLKSAIAAPVTVSIKEDFVASRGGLTNVSHFVTSVRPASDGNRVVVVARGDIFSVPVKHGPVRNLTDTSAAHEKGASWSPDGKWIAYVSDATGETELYVRAQDGRSTALQITQGADTDYFTPQWSPDSKKLLWGDRNQRLRYVDIQTKTVTEINKNLSSEYHQYTWSPDSNWIAYTQPEDFGESTIHLYSLVSKQDVEASEKWYEASSPCFSDDGKYLLFASGRDFHPIFSETEFNHAYENMQRVYMVTLAKDTLSPLKPQSDEVLDTAPLKEEKTVKKPVIVKVDADGIIDRVVGLPVEPSNYNVLRMVGDNIYYERTMAKAVDAGGAHGEGPESGPSSSFAAYNLKERKETVFGLVDSVEFTADGKKILARTGHVYAMQEVPSAKLELKEHIDFSNLEMHLDRHSEWNEIYTESWRRMRDYFYAPNMHGVNWPEIRAKYGSLIPYAEDRNDVTFLIGEMIGELHIGHTYVGGGDRPHAPRIATGLLGAELSRDAASNTYRIDKILKGENWQDGTRSPLTEIGVNVHTGDYILAVDGKPVSQMANIYTSLIGTAGKQVNLRVNSKPVLEGSREVTVVPIADEQPLYYYNWVQHNTDYVSEKTGGQVGYIHIPDMGFPGLDEFVKHFYPQLGKKALIIDDRGNGGGFVSPMIAERLRRELVMIEVHRNGQPVPNPKDMLVGPKVLLVNKYSASDGDIFPFRFRQYKLGKIIGERTWGGVVGIRGMVPVAVDGGVLSTPEFAPYSKDGKNWVIEGRGVSPDIEVDNEPGKEIGGIDQQLDRAISEVLIDLKSATQPFPLPPVPPYPDKH